MKKLSVMLYVFVDVLRELGVGLKRQHLARGYLLAMAILLLGVLFGFLALSPVLSSFIYPLF